MALGAWPLRAVMALCRPPGPPPPPRPWPRTLFQPPARPSILASSSPQPWPSWPWAPPRQVYPQADIPACPHRDMLRAGAAPGLPWGPPTAAGPGDLPASPAPWQSLHVESRTDLGKKFHSLHQVHH